MLSLSQMHHICLWILFDVHWAADRALVGLGWLASTVLDKFSCYHIYI
jgi:hypothetical protein